MLDGAAWRPEFLDYDYIGAVWPHVLDKYNVGNGGFSLRSKALLEACRALPMVDRLSVYTSGTCRVEPQAEYRTWRAMRWFKDHPVTLQPT